MFSVGIDSVEIDRIFKCMQKPNFYNKILGKDEYEQLKQRNFPKQSVAANFCAKEAFSKAIGTGIRDFDLREVELLREENGRPYLKFTGRALDICKKDNKNFSVSITHTKECATAVVIAWREI